MLTILMSLPYCTTDNQVLNSLICKPTINTEMKKVNFGGRFLTGIECRPSNLNFIYEFSLISCSCIKFDL